MSEQSRPSADPPSDPRIDAATQPELHAITGDALLDLSPCAGGGAVGLPLLAVLTPDELAEVVAGAPEPEGLADAYDVHFSGDVSYVLAHGRRPPLLEGFRRFLAHGSAGVPDASQSAGALLRDADAVERDLLAVSFADRDLGAVDPIAWAEAGALHLADARDVAAEHGAALAGLALGEAGATTGFARFVVAHLVVVALADAGWHPEALPGPPVALVHGGERVEPFAELHPDADVSGWAGRCAALGIGAIRF